MCTVHKHLFYKVTLYIFRFNAFQCINVIKDKLKKKDHEYGKETLTLNGELRYGKLLV